MIYLAEGILMGLTVVEALWHAHLIRMNLPIKHGWWFALFALLTAGMVWFIWDEFVAQTIIRTIVNIFLFCLAVGLTHLVLFNLMLNHFRHLDWFYMSAHTTSILDQMERGLFGTRIWKFEVVLVIIVIILQFFL